METSKYITHYLSCVHVMTQLLHHCTIAMMSFLLEHHCSEQAQLSQKLEGFFSIEMLM